MTGFTKGPWTSGVGTSTGMVVRANHEPKVRRNVASCGGMNREANANLIAAAPDMYEALEWLETYAMIQVDRHPDAEDNKGWRRIIAALAKARGKKT